MCGETAGNEVEATQALSFQALYGQGSGLSVHYSYLESWREWPRD
jgi:hypothetical protein